MKKYVTRFWIGAIFCFAGWVGSAIGATSTWTNTAGDQKWSTSANWSVGAPGVADDANFNTTATGVNSVDANRTVKNLWYGQTAGTMAFETQIGSGITLTNLLNVYVAYETANLSSICRVDVTGSGTFRAGNTKMIVGGRSSSGGAPNATMVFDGVHFVIDSLSDLWVGYTTHRSGPPQGTLDLSRAASVTSGGKPNSFIINNECCVGYEYGYGALHLPPSVTNIVLGSLKLGNRHTLITPYSLFDLGINPALRTLTVAGDVVINKGQIIYTDGSTLKTGFPVNVSVKIGSSAAPANMLLANVYALDCDVRWGGFRRFEAWLNKLYLGVGDNSKTSYGELDLTDTNTVELAGSFAHNKVAVNDVRLGGRDMYGTGVLKLPGSTTNITVGTLHMGLISNLSSPAYSVIHLGSNSVLHTLMITNEFRIARGQFEYVDGGGNSVTGTPVGLKVRIGSPTARASLVYIGEGRVQATVTRFGRGVTDFALYADKVNVGRGYGGGHYSTAELNLVDTTNLVFNVDGTLQITEYAQCNGYVNLFGGALGGTGSSSNLYVGNALNTYASQLVLSNVQFTVRNEMKTVTPGQVITYIDGVSSGIDMQSSNLDLGTTGAMHLVFRADPLNRSKAYWGLRMKGDARAQIEALIASPAKITYDISGLSLKNQDKFDIYYDANADQSYIGLPGVPSGTLIMLR